MAVKWSSCYLNFNAKIQSKNIIRNWGFIKKDLYFFLVYTHIIYLFIILWFHQAYIIYKISQKKPNTKTEYEQFNIKLKLYIVMTYYSGKLFQDSPKSIKY